MLLPGKGLSPHFDSTDAVICGGTISRKIVEYFGLPDDKISTILYEVIGGITSYLASVYMINTGPILQLQTNQGLNSTQISARYNFDSNINNELRVSYALVLGISTILNGLCANLPFVVGPGIPFIIAFNQAMIYDNPNVLLSANICIALTVMSFFLVTKNTKIYTSEDMRLGIAGIVSLKY